MNREIKFRVWCKQQEEMNIVEKMHFFEDGTFWCAEDKDREFQPPYFYDDDDFELMQFTGSRDKNGVEIYESDLMYVNGRLMIVRKGYHVTDSTLELKGFELDLIYGHYAESPCGSWQLNLGLSLNRYNVSVIGNEYSNPELLK